MDFVQLRQQVENACQLAQRPQTRQQGEQVLLQLREFPQALELCRYCLETNDEPVVQFHLAKTILFVGVRDLPRMKGEAIYETVAALFKHVQMALAKSFAAAAAAAAATATSPGGSGAGGGGVSATTGRPRERMLTTPGTMGVLHAAATLFRAGWPQLQATPFPRPAAADERCADGMLREIAAGLHGPHPQDRIHALLVLEAVMTEFRRHAVSHSEADPAADPGLLFARSQLASIVQAALSELMQLVPMHAGPIDPSRLVPIFQNPALAQIMRLGCVIVELALSWCADTRSAVATVAHDDQPVGRAPAGERDDDECPLSVPFPDALAALLLQHGVDMIHYFTALHVAFAALMRTSATAAHPWSTDLNSVVNYIDEILVDLAALSVASNFPTPRVAETTTTPPATAPYGAWIEALLTATTPLFASSHRLITETLQQAQQQQQQQQQQQHGALDSRRPIFSWIATQELSMLAQLFIRQCVNLTLSTAVASPTYSALALPWIETVAGLAALALSGLTADEDEEAGSGLWSASVKDFLEGFAVLADKCQVPLEFGIDFAATSNPAMPSSPEFVKKVQVLYDGLCAVAPRLVEGYIHIRLDIISQRALKNEAADGGDDSDDEENTPDDEDAYGDEMDAVGRMARLVPEASLGFILGRLHEDQTRLAQFMAADRAIFANAATELELHACQERLHWSLLIAGHAIGEDDHGEQPMLAKPLQLYAQTKPEQNALVLLPQVAMHLLDVHTQADRMLCASPLVARNLFWFFARWSRTYLLADVGTNPLQLAGPDYPPVLLKTFMDSAAAIALVHQLLAYISAAFQLWRAEEETIKAALHLVMVLSRGHLASHILTWPHFQPFTLSILDQLQHFPAALHSTLIQAVLQCIQRTGDEAMQTSYFKAVTDTMHASIDHITSDVVKHPKNAQNAEYQERVMYATDIYRGVARSAIVGNPQLIYNTCQEHFNHFNTLFERYILVSEVCQQIADLYGDIIAHQELSELSPANIAPLHASLVQMVDLLVRHHGSSRLDGASNTQERDTLLAIVASLFQTLHGLSDSHFRYINAKNLALRRALLEQHHADPGMPVAYCALSLLTLIPEPVLRTDGEIGPKVAAVMVDILQYTGEKILDPSLHEQRTTLLRTLDTLLDHASWQVQGAALRSLTQLAFALSPDQVSLVPRLGLTEPAVHLLNRVLEGLLWQHVAVELSSAYAGAVYALAPLDGAGPDGAVMPLLGLWATQRLRDVSARDALLEQMRQLLEAIATVRAAPQATATWPPLRYVNPTFKAYTSRFNQFVAVCRSLLGRAPDA